MESQTLVLDVVVDHVSDVDFSTSWHIRKGYFSDIIDEICKEPEYAIHNDEEVCMSVIRFAIRYIHWVVTWIAGDCIDCILKNDRMENIETTGENQ